jgi:hypothetical protein
MEWKNVGTLLERVTRLLHSKQVFKKAVVKAVADVLGVQILESDVTMENGVVYIKTSPLIKGEIFLQKRVLLELINKNNPTKPILDLH